MVYDSSAEKYEKSKSDMAVQEHTEKLLTLKGRIILDDLLVMMVYEYIRKYVTHISMYWVRDNKIILLKKAKVSVCH